VESGATPDPKANATENPGPGTFPFLRMWAVTRLSGLGRSTIYRLVAQDKFPSPVRLANRAIAWRRTDLERWPEMRPTVAH
jgi:prophage regulatory protein